MELSELARTIDPTRTVLLLGAGASIPAGGMTGAGFAQYLCNEVSGGQIDSDDLAEASSLLEHQYGRRALVEAVRDKLGTLKPDGSLLGLASLPWARVYTTNYDTLFEEASRARGFPTTVIRSNHDFANLDKGEREVIKIHGCISQDRSLGHNVSMLLTEDDYSEYGDYREALFSKLDFDAQTKDLLIIGHSMSDPHLKDLVNTVARRARKQATSNRTLMLLYSSDTTRIGVLADRNIRAAQGSLSELLQVVVTGGEDLSPQPPNATLPQALLHRTLECSVASTLPGNARRLFDGGSATHGDVASGFTFERSIESVMFEELISEERRYILILGASGTGKSTLARRVLARAASVGHLTYEHKSEFELDHAEWLRVAKKAEQSGVFVTLLVDDAARHLNAINRLCQEVESQSLKSLNLVITAQSGQWHARTKHPGLQKHGWTANLSTLTHEDVKNLVALCRTVPEIRALLQPAFANSSARSQIDAVTQVCKADMFVALKYCFPGDTVDRIILEEFASLPEPVAEAYKCVALLEASHGIPARQLVMEVMGIDWSEIDGIVKNAQGILQQNLVHAKDGVYSWNTRHRVIAEIIAFYKFSDQSELIYLLQRIIRSLNSAMLLDRQLVPALCDNEYAIGRVQSTDEKVRLLELLASRSNNRVPWHRLIATHIRLGNISESASAISRAEAAVNLDPPIHRYKIKLDLLRAADLKSLGTDDYLALLQTARISAEWGIARWTNNKYAYLAHQEVAREIFEATGDRQYLDDSAAWMREAYDEILDEDLLKWAGDIDHRDITQGRDPALEAMADSGA
ncbi:SIR2 family protein [Microbacterium sp. 22195]|uniref:SIR2 family protein n=1 Tax=Microbacterium sp. 22195 TaxID=3453891 RepID=UPI003F853850